MQSVLVLVALSSASLFGCSKVENVGPRITSGLYATEGASDKNLPAVSIQIADGKTYAYSFLQYECDGQMTAQFEKSGTTFSTDPVATGGPSVFVAGKKCDVQTEILADSPSTLKINVTLNGEKQGSYVLTKVSQSTFADTIKRLAAKASKFSVEEEACASTGTTCAQMELSSK